MPDRFVAVERMRYGTERNCILDRLTGHIAIFVSDVAGLADQMNANPEWGDKYVWLPDAPPATPEGNKE